MEKFCFMMVSQQDVKVSQHGQYQEIDPGNSSPKWHAVVISHICAFPANQNVCCKKASKSFKGTLNPDYSASESKGLMSIYMEYRFVSLIA